MCIRDRALVIAARLTLDEALAQAPGKLEGRDRAMAREMAFGVCRRFFELDGVLVQLLKKAFKSRDADVHALLLIGLYQMRYMRVPDHAAVSETVAACRQLGKPWAGGLTNAVLRQSMLVAVAVGLSCTALGTLLARPAVRLLGAPTQEVVVLSTTYLTTVAATLAFATLLYLGNACMRGAGDTRTPLYVMLVVNIVNIVVAWTLINGLFGLPKLGVWGSALGAASGQVVGGTIVLALLLRGKSGVQLRLAGLRPDWDMIRRILRVGMPTGLEQLFFRIGNMAYVRVLASLGVAAYAANQVAINGWSLSFMPGFGFAVAATTLVGQSLGARAPDSAERGGYVAYRMGAGLMAVIGLVMIFFPEQIMGFFTNDQEVIGLGALPLQVMGFVQPMLAASMIFAGALRGAGDTRWPMIITAGCIWLVRLPLAYLFAIVFGWGLVGAWSAMSLDMVLRGTFNFLRFRGGGWKTSQV